MKRKNYYYKYILAGAALLLAGVIISFRNSSHDEMVTMLKATQIHNDSPENIFTPQIQLGFYNKQLVSSYDETKKAMLQALKGELLLKVGREQEAVNTYEQLMNNLTPERQQILLPRVALAYLRLGERTNCMLNHNGSSCVFPLKDGGLHIMKTGSLKAIKAFEKVLKNNPDDLESRWLLNISYMTLGLYPDKVPAKYLLPGLDTDGDEVKVKPFTDMAPDLGLNINGKAGGVITDDFNNDGYIDIVTSGWALGDAMHYFQNNQDGTFSDLSAKSNLTGITGGLNIQQTDYNNDGNIDIYVLRGAWNGNDFGAQPNSLLRNNGDGTFTDVTITTGLLVRQPTQAAVWADLNNDGWLDLFMGAESNDWLDHPCTVFINNKNGTFSNYAHQGNADYSAYIKGVTAADYNKDGWVDIYISCLDGSGFLLKNKGRLDNSTGVKFEDVTTKAGLSRGNGRTFGTWFFDYDNDGYPDIMTADYDFLTVPKSLGYFAAAEALKKPVPGAGTIHLFKNKGDGTFTNVSKATGLDKVVYAMGCNFGDIDNDGYLDMYFGTGNPDFRSLVPNKMFKNVGGTRFADVTNSSRTGNLQKGHGIAFADFRNIGRQDIFAEIGGAFDGDSYTSSLYVNPGQGDNNWIGLKLEGVNANKVAMGSHIKLTFTENGIKRSVYKDVNSGGSFGSSPLRQEIGIGKATMIDEVEIKWAGTNKVQTFQNVVPNQFLHITEGNDKPKVIALAKLQFKSKPHPTICAPAGSLYSQVSSR